MDQDCSSLINVSFAGASQRLNEDVLTKISSLPGVLTACFFDQGRRAQVFSDGSRLIQDLAVDIERVPGVREAFAPILHMWI